MQVSIINPGISCFTHLVQTCHLCFFVSALVGFASQMRANSNTSD